MGLHVSGCFHVKLHALAWNQRMREPPGHHQTIKMQKHRVKESENPESCNQLIICSRIIIIE